MIRHCHCGFFFARMCSEAQMSGLDRDFHSQSATGVIVAEAT